MRTIKDLLPKKQLFFRDEKRESILDEKTVFYVVKKVLIEEYGIRGGENIIPTLYQDKKLFLSSQNSLWGNEIWLERSRLKEKINLLLGGGVIEEIKIGRD